MKPVIDILEDRIAAAMAAAGGGENSPAIVRPTAEPKFGDYQANGVMALAKKLKTNPRKLAEEVVAKLDISDICEPPEIAGPGFINLRLKTDYVAKQILEIKDDTSGRLAVSETDQPKTIVVDFSSPNIAKQMHVGHLRSTIIGDSICRLLEFTGHKVIRQNHIGDWGTQFGMLVQRLLQKASGEATTEVILEQQKERHTDDPSTKELLDAIKITAISDLEEFYREAKELFDNDPDFQNEARKRVVELHDRKNEFTFQIWQHLIDESRKHYQPIYDILRVNLHEENERGESSYNNMLPDVVKDLTKASIAKESDGAICVFPPGFKNKDGDDLPFIIQKSDGAYLYATTDLAALRYRVNELKADKIVYVTDARQKLHFEMLFTVAQMAKWAEGTDLAHVMFGSVLGENGKPLKTRSGENVKLKELLDEAVERARAVVHEKNPDLPDDKKTKIATAVGIGAIKYADYSNNRTSDYVFSFDKMLAMEGNTAPYMQYAYARIKSIERKDGSTDEQRQKQLREIQNLNLTEPAEIDLAKHLIRYGEAIEAAAGDYRPNYLTTYLFELAQKFSTFYTNCPVLKADPDKRPTRLLLCDLTAETIRHGLVDLLGIEVVGQM
ncbi:MAG: arginine--tRNA ligase [Planctomycetota bacterium]|jgi:arginyl-tRNA synthetase